jgi:hypothetical protein
MTGKQFPASRESRSVFTIIQTRARRVSRIEGVTPIFSSSPIFFDNSDASTPGIDDRRCDPNLLELPGFAEAFDWPRRNETQPNC